MFASYAQNFEDVYLHRLFGDRETGTYVDVGAFSPVEHSVTKIFYDRGWSGINIEPVPELFETLVSQRPRDVNLPMALGAATSRAPFFAIPASGLSSLLERSAEAARARHGFTVTEQAVDVRRLDDVWEEHLGWRQIEFLKIDVEGYEAEVLSGASEVLRRALAEVIIVEAIEPGTTTPCEDRFEHLLTEVGYQSAWFDGVNRWYLAPGRHQWAVQLAIPVNCFDNAAPAHLIAAEQRLNVLAAEMTQRDERIGQLTETVERLSLDLSNAETTVIDLDEQASRSNAEVADLRRELAGVYGSETWKMTRPIRKLIDTLKHH